jgi:hypothetical protein
MIKIKELKNTKLIDMVHEIGKNYQLWTSYRHSRFWNFMVMGELLP